MIYLFLLALNGYEKEWPRPSRRAYLALSSLQRSHVRADTLLELILLILLLLLVDMTHSDFNWGYLVSILISTHNVSLTL